MKKKVSMFAAVLTAGALLLAGCASSGGDAGKESKPASDNTTVEQTTEAATEESTEATTEASKEQVMSIAEFEELLAQQPLAVSKTEYAVQDEQYKALYPDLLQAIIVNNTTEDIKDAVIAFVAWDSNNLPVKIEGQFDFGQGSYIKQVNYTDINLVGGDTFGEKDGYPLGENNEIATFKAMVVSFKTFDGDTWKNPYFDDFRSLYEGKKYSDDMTIEVEVVDSGFSASENAADGSADKKAESSVTAEELESNLSEQPVVVIKTEYVVQNQQYKTIYPDMLQAVIQNNTEEDIKDAVIAFVAWDSNNLPVKIVGQFDFDDGSYVKKVNYTDINLAGGNTYGEKSGYSLNEHCEIENFKAIVVSYETFEGETWENPYFDDFRSLYEGKKLN